MKTGPLSGINLAFIENIDGTHSCIYRNNVFVKCLITIIVPVVPVVCCKRYSMIDHTWIDYTGEG